MSRERPRPVRRASLAAVWVGVLALVTAACAGADDGSATQLLAADEAVEVLDEGDTTVIDVRTPEEFEEGHVDGARLIDFQSDDFEERVDELDRDEPYVLYCATGNRSGQAAEVMEELGFTEVLDAGGYDDLAAAGAATER